MSEHFFLFLIQWHVTLTSVNHWKEVPSEFVHSYFLKPLNPDRMDFQNILFIKISHSSYTGVIRWRPISVHRSRNQITWPFWHKFTYLTHQNDEQSRQKSGVQIKPHSSYPLHCRGTYVNLLNTDQCCEMTVMAGEALLTWSKAGEYINFLEMLVNSCGTRGSL